MSRSLLAAIRAAVMPEDAEPILTEDQPGASTPTTEASPPRAIQEEDEMSEPSNKPAGAAIQPAAGNSSNDDAVQAAGLAGEERGAKAANDRMAAILSAEGVKGDGKRMGAALDLALNSPDMAADQVTSFVTANVPASSPTAASGQSAHDRRRLDAMPHAQPGEDQPRGGAMRVDIVADMKRRNGLK